MEFADLKGLVLDKIEVGEHREVMRLVASDGRKFVMEHDQDCCENVQIEDICGDLEDLLGSPILRAEERTEEITGSDELSQYTFYELATIKGSVTIRWLGESNGYYGVEVTFRAA